MKNAGKNSPTKGHDLKTTGKLSAGVAALVMAGYLQFMPGASMEKPVCHDDSTEKLPAGFLGAHQACQLIESQESLSFLAERWNRIKALGGSAEEKAQKMGIQITEIQANEKPDYEFVANKIRSMLSIEEGEKFIKLLTIGYGFKDKEIFRGVSLLEEQLKNEETDWSTIVRHVRYIASNTERVVNHLAFMDSEFQKEVQESSNQASELWNISENPSEKKLFSSNELSRVRGMSNVEGQIISMSAVLDNRLSHSIIDILKQKTKEGDDFMFHTYYSNSRELLEFLTDLEKEQIPNVGKYLKLVRNDSLQEGALTVMSPWLRDSTMVTYDPMGKPVMLRSQFSKLNGVAHNASADYLAFRDNMPMRQSSLIFTGGNVRQTQDTIFIGWDDILYNIPRLQEFIYSRLVGTMKEKFPDYDWSYGSPEPLREDEVESVIKQFEQEFGKKVVVLGKDTEKDLGYQQIYHLDIFFTPLGGKKVALAELKTPWMDSIRKDLISKGYEIFPIPTQVGGKQGQYTITYNNVEVEHYIKNGKNEKHVYVPQYADSAKDAEYMSKLDKEAIVAWEKTGFKVVPVRVHVDNLLSNGSLNCRVSEIRR